MSLSPRRHRSREAVTLRDRATARRAYRKVFPGISSAELAALERRAVPAFEPAGTPLLRQGGLGDAVLVLVSGTVRVDRNADPVGNESAPTVLGELSVLGPLPYRTATVTAASPVTVAVISRADFVTLYDRCPAVTRAVDALYEDRSPGRIPASIQASIPPVRTGPSGGSR